MRVGWAGKIALGAVVPVVAGLAVFAFWALNRVRVVTEDTVEANHRVAATLLAHALTAAELRDAPRLQARVDRLGREVGARITVIDGEGRVIADSEVRDVSSMENHGLRPEVAAARRDGTALVRRYSHTVRRELLYAAARIQGHPAIVRIARDVSGVEEELRRPTERLWWVAAGVVLLGVGGALLFARGFARPLKELTAAAGRLQGGDLDARVSPRGGDEVARLGHAFNRMAEQLEKSLAASRAETARLTRVLEGMTEGVIAVDAEERISFLNGAARAILGLGDRDLAGVRLYELVRDPAILGLVQVAADGDDAAEAEVRHDGPPRRMIQVYAAPVAADMPGVILVLRDMSRLRRLERMRSDFVSNVSHELRTPLASIAAAVETLEDGAANNDPEAGPRFLAMIRRNVSRLEALLNDILALSRLETRPETLERAPVDLAAVVRASVEELLQRARAGEVTLRVDAAVRRTVHGDQGIIRRVVDNLVVNAITYTPAGGKVDVTVVAENDEAVLRVTDTGIGIPKDDQDRIFERFYRVDKARSRSAGGTGLGLAIVKHGVGLHGGSVEVDSRLAKGSTFTVRFPLARGEDAGTPGDAES